MAPTIRPRAGYLGPEGTFSEEALLASALADALEPVPLASIYDVVMQLRAGELEWALVPVENSLEGSIGVTLDLLAERASELQIVAETLLRVRHSLIACEPVALSEIDTVLSHPQVPGQCERFLREELAHARVLPASSTAEAVRLVARERKRNQAALGTVLAAEIYGASVLREGVQDSHENETRFLWLARMSHARQAPPVRDVGGESKTSLVFWGAGAQRAGWLVRCLDEFARREINLTKIESRPRRSRLGSYMFFADLSGGAQDRLVCEAVAGVASLCEEVRVLGSYRSAREPDRDPLQRAEYDVSGAEPPQQSPARLRR
jgi:prephenate dehydratase